MNKNKNHLGVEPNNLLDENMSKDAKYGKIYTQLTDLSGQITEITNKLDNQLNQTVVPNQVKDNELKELNDQLTELTDQLNNQLNQVIEKPAHLSQPQDEAKTKKYHNYVNINNIHKTIAVYKGSMPYREEIFAQYIPYMTKLWQTPSKEIYQITFALCLEFINELVKFPTFALLLKQAYDDAIIKHKYIQFIRLYNMTYNDDLYSENLFDIEEPLELNEVDIQKLTTTYNQTIKKRTNFKRKVYTFNDNEVVGARDKQGSWWHAKVLKRLSYKNHYVYYVEFSHWGEEFNEWISDSRRIMKYNPKRHVLYRPAWIYDNPQ